MHEITRILKKGGHLIIGVPNLASLHNRLLLSFGIQPTCIQINSAHIRGFTKVGIKGYLDSVWQGDYSIEKFKGSNFYPFPSIIANVLSKIFPSLSVSIFFLLKKRKKYSNQIINYPTKNKLETNYFFGSII